MKRLVCSALLIVCCLGCNEVADTDSPSGSGGEVTAGEGHAQAGSTAASGDPQDAVRVTVKSLDEILQFVASQTGKVVVVDYWATYCEPCKKEFPGLVALHKELGDKVACVSVNLDFYGDELAKAEANAKKFLTENGATFTNFVCNDEDSKVYDRLEFQNVPGVFVYDRSGELHSKIVGEEGVTYESDITPLVKKLLGDA